MGKWVTIKGAHVYIEDDNTISKGPKAVKEKNNTEKETNKTSSVLNNRKNLVNYVKQQIDIDLDKVATENQFAPRRGLNIDSSKMTINELNNVKHIMAKKDIRMESNGIKDYFIYYEKKKSDETTKQKNFIKSHADLDKAIGKKQFVRKTRDSQLVKEDIVANNKRLEQVNYKIKTTDGMTRADYIKEKHELEYSNQKLSEEYNRSVKEEKSKGLNSYDKSYLKKKYDEGGPRYF